MQKPFTIIIILAIILAVGGGVYFFVVKKPLGDGGTQKSLDELEVKALELDFSLSPLPKLNVSSLNLSSPSLPSGNIFSGFSVDTNFSYQGNLNISAPATPQLNIPVQQQQSQQPAANAASCAAFSSIPSGYCSMAGSSGQALCQQCEAAGF